MVYLKCDDCGFLNEFKTEYLTFCGACNQKLKNNFNDWKKIHTEKTLDDFKELHCVSKDKLVTEGEDKRKSNITNPQKLKTLIGIIIGFSIFSAIGKYGGESLVRFFRSEKTSESILDQKWYKETYGNYGLIVETPIKMTSTVLDLPANIKQYVANMDSYNYMSTKGFKVFINSIKYKPSVGTVSLQGAANGSANEIKMQKGVTDFDYKEETILKSEIPGFKQQGTFKTDGIMYEFINVGLAQGLFMWQVVVTYQMDDEVGKTAAKRVIESIVIANKTNLT